MKESHPEQRTYTLWWHNSKNLTSKKHQICGEDIEFQGGRKVQQQSLPNHNEIIEYHCSTPKKGSAPWSRSIVKLRDSPLWVVNYRPRRVRASDANANKRSMSKLGRSAPANLTPSKKRKLNESPNVPVKKIESPGNIHFRIPVTRCASENSGHQFHQIPNIPPPDTHNNHNTHNHTSSSHPALNYSPSFYLRSNLFDCHGWEEDFNHRHVFNPNSSTTSSSSSTHAQRTPHHTQHHPQHSPSYHFHHNQQDSYFPDDLLDLEPTLVPPTQPPPHVHRMVERTFSDPDPNKFNVRPAESSLIRYQFAYNDKKPNRGINDRLIKKKRKKKSLSPLPGDSKNNNNGTHTSNTMRQSLDGFSASPSPSACRISSPPCTPNGFSSTSPLNSPSPNSSSFLNKAAASSTSPTNFASTAPSGLSVREITIMGFVDRLTDSQNDISQLVKEASSVLDSSRDLQQFHSIVRLVIGGAPIRNRIHPLSKQSRLLLYTLGCIDSR